MMKMINNNLQKNIVSKKILIFSLAYYPLMGGAEIAIKEITDRICSTEIEFDLITLRFDNKLPKIEKVGNVTIYRMGFTKSSPSALDLVKFPLYLNKIFYPISAFLKVKKLDKIRHYDGFWSMMSYAGFPIILFRMFSRKVPYLLSLQEGDDLKKVNNRLRLRVVNFLFKRIFREAKIVQPISNYLADFARKMRVTESKIKIVPNGISITKFKRKFSTNEARLKLKLNIPFNSNLIVSVSRLVSKNAIDVLIKTLSFLPRNYYLLIAGDGPDKNSLVSIAKKEGVLDRVYFFGNLSNEDVADFISAGNVFSRISRFEGQGIAFLEAMSLEVPVVASKVGGITDFIKSGETGLLSKVDDPEDTAEKIKKLIDDNQLRKKIIVNAKNLVLNNYNWDNLYILIKQFLIKL